MTINRSTITQSLIDKYGFKTYLEIGVESGKNFFPIKAGRKIAVDPYLKFSPLKQFFKAIQYPANMNASYFRMESDRFFTEKADKVLQSTPLDICLVDGMHEYAYALRDTENCLNRLAANGVIIMHDCNPQTPEASYTWAQWNEHQCQGFWNGDVWKSIMHLRSLHRDINVFVLDADHGLGIVTRGAPENPLSFTQEQIERFTYADLAANRQEWLNLKPAEYFKEYFKM
jgi:hypothetical protein